VEEVRVEADGNEDTEHEHQHEVQQCSGSLPSRPFQTLLQFVIALQLGLSHRLRGNSSLVVLERLDSSVAGLLLALLLFLHAGLLLMPGVLLRLELCLLLPF